jgi:hypothetical protein
MTPEQNVYTVLAATAGVTALVGNRIYPVQAPTNAQLPYLVYQRIATEPVVTHEQTDAQRAFHLDGCHFQFTAIATTVLAAATIIYQARLAVEHSAGLQAVWLNEYNIPRIEESQAFGHAADFLVWKDPD